LFLSNNRAHPWRKKNQDMLPTSRISASSIEIDRLTMETESVVESTPEHGTMSTETPVQPDERTQWQIKSEIRFEKWLVKLRAGQAERKRLHDLLPSQERFYKAVSWGQFGDVKNFLESGEVDVNQDHHWYSPLQNAAMRGHAEIVQILLLYGADASHANHRGDTALHIAVRNARHKRYEKIVSALIQHGSEVASIGFRGTTPLHCAILHAPSAIVKILLNNGADISIKDDTGSNAMHLVALRFPRSIAVQNKICRMLLEHPIGVRAKLRVLLEYDNMDHDASDSDDEMESFTPSELASLMEKPALVALMDATEQRCIQELRDVKTAKLARESADRKQNLLALSMGLHPRIGELSAIMGLNRDLVQMIGKYI
jgi:hypothetical protein